MAKKKKKSSKTAKTMEHNTSTLNQNKYSAKDNSKKNSANPRKCTQCKSILTKLEKLSAEAKKAINDMKAVLCGIIRAISVMNGGCDILGRDFTAMTELECFTEETNKGNKLDETTEVAEEKEPESFSKNRINKMGTHSCKESCTNLVKETLNNLKKEATETISNVSENCDTSQNVYKHFSKHDLLDQKCNIDTKGKELSILIVSQADKHSSSDSLNNISVKHNCIESTTNVKEIPTCIKILSTNKKKRKRPKKSKSTSFENKVSSKACIEKIELISNNQFENELENVEKNDFFVNETDKHNASDSLKSKSVEHDGIENDTNFVEKFPIHLKKPSASKKRTDQKKSKTSFKNEKGSDTCIEIIDLARYDKLKNNVENKEISSIHTKKEELIKEYINNLNIIIKEMENINKHIPKGIQDKRIPLLPVINEGISNFYSFNTCVQIEAFLGKYTENLMTGSNIEDSDNFHGNSSETFKHPHSDGATDAIHVSVDCYKQVNVAEQNVIEGTSTVLNSISDFKRNELIFKHSRQLIKIAEEYKYLNFINADEILNTIKLIKTAELACSVCQSYAMTLQDSTNCLTKACRCYYKLVQEKSSVLLRNAREDGNGKEHYRKYLDKLKVFQELYEFSQKQSVALLLEIDKLKTHSAALMTIWCDTSLQTINDYDSLFIIEVTMALLNNCYDYTWQFRTFIAVVCSVFNVSQNILNEF